MSYIYPSLYATIQLGDVDVNFIFASTQQHTDILIKVNKDFDEKRLHNYHIHEGYCSNNPNHWDPLNVKSSGANYTCDTKDFKTCEVGDLSGKFGKLKGEVKNYNFTDPTITFDMLVRNKLSVVIHKPDSKDQLACENISFNKEAYRTTKAIVGKRFLDGFINKIKNFGNDAFNTIKGAFS